MAQIYRVGKDIFDASTNQKIANPNVLATQYKGATEIQAPNLNVPTGATKISDPNYLKTAGLTEKDIFRQGKDIYQLPKIDPTLNVETATPDVPTPEPVNDVSSFMSGLDTGNKGLQAQLEMINKQSASEKEISEIRKRQDALTEQAVATQQKALPTAEQFGLTENTKNLQGILPQIESLKAQFDNAEIAQEGRKGLAGSIYGRQALIQRQRAVELAGLSAIAQAYQGNIELAQTTAKNMVEMELAPIQTQIDNQVWQLEQVQDQLTREESRKAESLNLVLNERQRLLNEEKEKKNNISNLAITAAQNGADQATIEKIMKANDYMTAIRLSSQFLQEGKWTESEITDANGNPLLYNENTGEYKTSVGTSTGDIFFTDANGDSWNIAGWATDQTKPQQMNAIAKRIGKVTDENINEKVKEFTPGLTADMIKEASAMSGVSWEALMTMVNQEAQGGMSNVAKANNNFGGLTFNNQEWIKAFGGDKGTARPSAEGGNYIKFPTKQQGLNAMAALMASYGKVVPSSPESQFSRTAIDWAESIRDGKAKLSDITSEVEKSNPGLKSEVIAVQKTLPPSDPQIKDAQNFIKDLEELRDSGKGLKSAVGPTALARGFFGTRGAMSGERDAFLGKADTIISKKALDALIDAKSQGATFGALSDTEMNILKSAATTLGAWSESTDKGKLKYFDVDEDTFKAELNKLINDYKDLVSKANVVQSLDAYLENNPEKVDEYNTILSNNPNLTEEEILQIIQ